ncbi:MAG: hypothetical protein WC759_01740 [Candidatus Micrarchaeia archaeon]|jgi:hypothetical protein
MAGIHRAQAGTEFLFTYGWALLLIVVCVAVLIQLDIFDLGSYVSPGTDISGFNTFAVATYRLNADGSIHLTLINRLEDAVTVQEVRVNGVPVSSPSPAMPFSMNSSSTVLFSADTAMGGNPGSAYSASVVIRFDVNRGGTDHLDSGILRSTLQP